MAGFDAVWLGEADSSERYEEALAFIPFGRARAGLLPHDVPAGKELDPAAWRDSVWMVLLRREHEFAVHAFGF